MDERYADTSSVAEAQVTSLTGLSITAESYPYFRNRLLVSLPNFYEGPEGSDSPVHASDLFRDRPDKEHFAFYNELVSIVNALGCRIYRRGFNFVPNFQMPRDAEKSLLWWCFRSMLIAATESEDSSHIWPVMEIDHTKLQDHIFAGYVRWMDRATAHLNMTGEGVKELIDENSMVDNVRIGDLHYVSKKSMAGSAVDCLAYLLHCNWLNEIGCPLTHYKQELAQIASNLEPPIVDDYIALFREDSPEQA